MMEEYIFTQDQPLRAQLEAAELRPPGLVFNYPPIGAWHNCENSPAPGALWHGSDRYSHNLYVHIPFCRQKCSFCYYNVVVAGQNELEQAWRYLRCLEKEAQAYADIFADRKIATVFIGGGTPSRLTEPQMEFLFEKVINRFSLARDCEISFEGAPDSITLSKLKLARSLGVTRVTMGVQSFNSLTLAKTRRDDDQDTILGSYDAMVESGISTTNIDLIAGVEYEDRSAMEDNMLVLERMAVRPSQLTLFTLSVREGAIDKKTLYLLQERTPEEVYRNSLDLYDYARTRLFDMGYWQYSKNLFPSADNIFRYQDNLWGNNGYCLALGASGYSHSNWGVYLNTFRTADYIESVEAGRSPVERAYPLSESEQIRRHMVLAMKHAKLDYAKFNSFYEDVTVQTLFAEEIRALCERRIVLSSEGGIQYTSHGIASVDRYVRAFFSGEVNRVLISRSSNTWSRGDDAFRFVR